MPSFGARHRNVLQPGVPSLGHPRAAKGCCSHVFVVPVRVTVATSSAASQAPALSILAFPKAAGVLQGKAGC